MVVGEASINNIMGGIENTGGVRLHNHRRKLKQRFDIIKKLGQGTYGKVQLGINKETGQAVAIKTIKKSKIETEADLIRIRREIQIMSSVQHPNIIHIYEVFENREKMVLVMEYAAGGELYDYLSERKVLSEEEARRIFRQIATACYYCHKHKICHRDLKLENILLDENGSAKIADFGLSNVFDDQRLLATFCGSPLYASPEIVKGTPYQGPEVDCWSLGVLLYTLVYGAMPFDGSNFKRLVKQISQGDYFEPKKPSPASPLIREMLTVNPKNRADIEKICNHWWVNDGYDDSCFDISEELANQTPVRLDLLLSLAPPPPQLESDKLVVTGEGVEESGVNAESLMPTRSQSVGSLMEFTHPAERRIKELIAEDIKVSPKRKLETTVSTDHANLSNKGAKRKELVKENTVADIYVPNSSLEDASMPEAVPLSKNLTQTISREMDVEHHEEYEDLSSEGAACANVTTDAEKQWDKATIKESSSVEKSIDKENIDNNQSGDKVIDKKNTKKGESKGTVKKKVPKKVLSDKNENSESESKSNKVPAVTDEKQQQIAENVDNIESSKNDDVQPPSKSIERRQSRIFETAEKFQNMIAASESKSAVPEKPKKIFIPGVNVDCFKKEFEKKSAPTNASAKTKSSILKQTSVDKQKSDEEHRNDVERKKSVQLDQVTGDGNVDVSSNSECIVEEERKQKVKNAVSIISNVLDKEGTRKSKSRPCMTRKPPVPFGTSGRSNSESIGMISTLLSPTPEKHQFKLQVGPNANDTRLATVQVSTPEHIKYAKEPKEPESIREESKTSSAEITLKSATLPRRKTTKAEIKLDYPVPKPATMEFKTEMAHHIEGAPKLATQRSEVTFPVSSPPPTVNFRATSLEPEKSIKIQPKERIIPISFEKETVPPKPPVPKSFQTQKSTVSQRSNSLSRQSTQESDSETTVSGEPIRKSPREYIIPIAVEGGGYVTPRAGSLEPSDTASTTSTMTNNSRRSANKFIRPRRMSSLLNDRDGSEDESPFSTLHRHTSFGKDSDTEDSRRGDSFHMHRLRSSRPRKPNLEHTDSLSSGEDDDDDGFELLTAENLFSTLLSRVRGLTQRLNVEDGGRPGFPSSRLLFDHGTNFWNLHNRIDPLSSRRSPVGRSVSREHSSNKTGSFGAPWRRSVSRDLASDIESVFNDSHNPTHSATLPRGDTKAKKENLNLSDLDLKKLNLSEEDALALSYLTPGLTRRIQKKLLTHLSSSEARKLSRTLSVQQDSARLSDTTEHRRSVDRYPSTLPRRCSVENNVTRCFSKETTPNFQKSTSKPRSSENPVEKPDEYNSAFKKDGVSQNKSHLLHKSANQDSGDIPLEYFENQKLAKNLNKHNDIVENYKNKSNRVSRSFSLREPKSENIVPKVNCRLQNSDISKNNDSSSFDDSASTFCLKDNNANITDRNAPDLYINKYTPTRYYDTSRLYASDSENKSDISRPFSSTRRVSRFLRPDFFDASKGENVYIKEKKEREMETQKVLKEIRDKRIKNRINLRRERSESRALENNSEISTKPLQIKEICASGAVGNTNNTKLESSQVSGNNCDNDALNTELTTGLLKNVSDNIEKLETNVKCVLDQVPAGKKERVSKLLRPKSYPSETYKNSRESIKTKCSNDNDSKLKANKEKNDSVVQKPEKNVKKKHETEKSSNKNKFLQSIEKKFEKLRSFTNSPNAGVDNGSKAQEKVSSVENAIKRLREQSCPRSLENCITTESGLIKRAVSVEDLSSLDAIGSNSKTLQASRKSVTKILGLFKKYEEKDNKKQDKILTKTKRKGSDTETKTTEKSKCEKTTGDSIPVKESKLERPRSLLLDRAKCFQNNNGADTKSKISKLPVNAFRRSLNLEKTQTEPTKMCKNLNGNNVIESCNIDTESKNEDIFNRNKPDRKNLRLNLSNFNTPVSKNPKESTFNDGHNNVLTDNCSLLSPTDDNDISCDSWSVCSDFHTQDLSSPISPNGHVYSGDENESVIDRIRRKSFYTRFNEHKRPRKSHLTGYYKDMDFYKDLGQHKSKYALSNDVSSLKRRSLDYRSPYDRKSGYSNSVEGPVKDNKLFTQSSSLSSDRHLAYNPKLHRHVNSLYSPTSEDTNALDDHSATGKSRKYSYQTQPSRLAIRSSISPMNEHFSFDSNSSSLNHPVSTPTSHT